MSIKYNKIKKFPSTFNRLFGVQVEQFEEILRRQNQNGKQGSSDGIKGLDDRLNVSFLI